MRASVFSAADAKRLKENMRTAYFLRVWDTSQQADFFTVRRRASRLKKSQTWPWLHCLPK